MFSQPWIKSFLDHAFLHRRKVTSTIKELPAIEVVQERMNAIAATQSKYKADETISADETAVLYGLQPKNQYVPTGATRGEAPDSDEKSRYTSMQAGDGDGDMLPSFNVIKCFSKKTDLTGTRVLKVLHGSDGFTSAKGWDMFRWTRTLTLLDKKKVPFTKVYSRPLLKHRESGIVITIQHKAWMDCAGICMWVDVVVGPHFAAKRKKGLIIWDNCGSHCMRCVKEVIAEWGLEEEKLPVNMTGKLQIMDLVVNGPYKAGVRRRRCHALFEYLQSWKIRRLQQLLKPLEERELPRFSPPKPDLRAGLLNSFAVERELFEQAQFKLAVRRSFVAAGQIPRSDGTYVRYTSHTTSRISACLIHLGKVEEAAFSACASTADVEACEDEDEPATDDEVEDEATEE